MQVLIISGRLKGATGKLLKKYKSGTLTVKLTKNFKPLPPWHPYKKGDTVLISYWEAIENVTRKN